MRRHKLMLAVAGLAIVVLVWVVRDWNAPRHQGRTAQEWLALLTEEAVAPPLSFPLYSAKYGEAAMMFQHFDARAASVLKRRLSETWLRRLMRWMPQSISKYNLAWLERHLKKHWTECWIAAAGLAANPAAARESIPELIRGLGEQDIILQCYCVEALGKINCGDPRIDQALLRASKDIDQDVRVQAGLYRAYTAEDSPEVRKAVQQAFQGFNERLHHAKLEIWSQEIWFKPVRRNSDEWIADLRRYSPNARYLAIQALKTNRAESAKIIPTLIQSLDDENERVRTAAAEALAEFGAKANAALPKLKTLHGQSSGLQRERIAGAVVMIDPAAALQEINAR